MANITALLTERKQLLNQLNSMYYGSIEIRKKDDKQYIYVHFRLDGVLTTKYVGENGSGVAASRLAALKPTPS